MKIMIHIIKEHLDGLFSDAKLKLSPHFEHLFSEEEVADIVEMYNYNNPKDMLDFKHMSTNERASYLCDELILQRLLLTLEEKLNKVSDLTQEEVHEFFVRTQRETHYLFTKPVEEWDSYDVGNYRSLLMKYGKLRKVYAIFTSEVREDDKYLVTTQPSLFFDTREDAERDLNTLYKEGNFQPGDLKIMDIWKLA